MSLTRTSGPKLVRLLLGACAVASLTCSDSPSGPIYEPCPGDAVTLQVSPGLTPLFTWTPACGVAFLEVYTAGGGAALWTAYAGSGPRPQNLIPSGVRYGITPPRGRTVDGPQPLQAGNFYDVGVGRMVCDQRAVCELYLAAERTFQP
jgi:hypothetical protein